eukprot:2992580-Pleurochrysis_carterae.AAC.3
MLLRRSSSSLHEAPGRPLLCFFRRLAPAKGREAPSAERAHTTRAHVVASALGRSLSASSAKKQTEHRSVAHEAMGQGIPASSAKQQTDCHSTAHEA